MEVTRIHKIALISSPFIALYGVTPIYIFGFIPLYKAIPVCLGLTLFTYVGWLINIYVLSITRNKKRWVQYALSYCLTFLFHLFTFIVTRLVGLPEESDTKLTGDLSILIYPVMSILASNTVTLIVINLLQTQEKSQHAERKIQKLTVSNLEAEKKILQQQLQPHFLFNALSTLKSLIKENPDEAENYAVKLSEFLRYSIDANKTELVSLEDELQFTEGYIELQKTRFPNSFFCSIHVTNDLLNRKIPVFGLQTLVENAIKHNRFTSKKPLNITISSNGSTIKVTNNKLQKNVYASNMGTGLSNLNKRYQLIAEKEINIRESDSEFMVILELL